MIEVSRLTKKYGDFTAVDGISFKIEKGEICGFLGPNGAGKTSTMRILTGYMPPTSGEAVVAGYNVHSDPIKVKRRVGYLPESTPLYYDMRVAEYIEFVAEIKGIRGAATLEAARDVMDQVGILDRSKSLIGSLSKGLKQRVGLAQALLNDPEVLILDEPTIGLDPRQIREIRSLIKDLGGRRTVILSSHILTEVQMVCSQVIVINDGKLLASDTMKNLTNREVSSITAKIDGPASEILMMFEQIPGVTEVNAHGGEMGAGVSGPIKYEIGLEKGANPRKEIVRLIANKNWELIDLAGSAGSLEDIYIKLITEDQALKQTGSSEEAHGEDSKEASNE